MISRIHNRTTVLNKNFCFIPHESTKEFISYFDYMVADLRDAVHDDDKEKFTRFIEATEPKRSEIVRFKRNDGVYKFNLVCVDAEDSEGNKRIRIYEIDEVMEKNELLYVESRYLRKVLSMTGEFMFNYNKDTNNIKIYHYANDNRTVLVDMDLEKWIDNVLEQKFVDEANRRDLEYLAYDLKDCMSSFNRKLFCGIRTSSEIKEHVRFVGVYHEDIGHNGHYMVGRILSELDMKQATSSQNLIGELQLDALTGLLNKKTITNIAKQRCELANPSDRFAICIMDLDYFKPVNDQFGHMAGDKVLTRVATKLKEIIGEDGTIGRIGGDEFMIIFNDVFNQNILRGYLRTVNVLVRKEFEGNFEGLKLSCSLGASVYSTNGTTYEELFQKADFCLYVAKEKGRDRYVFFRDDLHGEKYANFNTSKSMGQKTETRDVHELRFVDKFASALKSNKKPAVLEAMRHMLGTYNCDTINLYMGEDMHRVLSVGLDSPEYSNAKFALERDFQDELIEGRFIKYNFDHEFPKSGKFHEALISRRTKSTLMFIIGDLKNIKGLVTLERINAPAQWADYEFNSASIFTNLLEVIDFKVL